MAQDKVSTNVVSTWYGGTGGDHWDDGILFGGVREITLRHGSFIDSIGVVYERNGKEVTAPRHGGNGGSEIKIPLEPREFLTKVIGHFAEAKRVENSPVVIQSLTFESNFNKIYGPYGQQDGTRFAFHVQEGEKIIGIFGRSGVYLHAIGFHVTRA